MEDFDIYDDITPAQPFLTNYQSRLWGREEAPSDKSIEVDPIKLSIEWVKAVKRTKDFTSFMSYVEDRARDYMNTSPRGSVFTGYAQGQISSSYVSSMFLRTNPSGMIFSSLSGRYPIQPDTGTKD